VISTGHAVFITHRVRSGARDAVKAVWLAHMAPAVAANDGHIAYYYCYDAQDGDILRVFQLYRDAAAAAEFLTIPAYQAYLAEVEPLLLGPPEVHAALPQWQKALS
jgi:quinol monooxygenase YgiN